MTISFGSKKLIEAGDMSASFQSEAINLHNKHSYSIHAIFTGSPVGSSYLAVSIDGTNWIVLADSTQAIAAAGDIFYNVDAADYSWVRQHYVFSSGTGTMNSFFNTKGEF